MIHWNDQLMGKGLVWKGPLSIGWGYKGPKIEAKDRNGMQGKALTTNLKKWKQQRLFLPIYLKRYTGMDRPMGRKQPWLHFTFWGLLLCFDLRRILSFICMPVFCPLTSNDTLDDWPISKRLACKHLEEYNDDKNGLEIGGKSMKCKAKHNNTP